MCRDDMPCDLCCVPPAVHSTNIFNLSKIVKNLVELSTQVYFCEIKMKSSKKWSRGVSSHFGC